MNYRNYCRIRLKTAVSFLASHTLTKYYTWVEIRISTKGKNNSPQIWEKGKFSVQETKFGFNKKNY